MIQFILKVMASLVLLSALVAATALTLELRPDWRRQIASGIAGEAAPASAGNPAGIPVASVIPAKFDVSAAFKAKDHTVTNTLTLVKVVEMQREPDQPSPSTTLIPLPEITPACEVEAPQWPPVSERERLLRTLKRLRATETLLQQGK